MDHQPDLTGHPQCGQSGGKVLGGAKVIALAGSFAHRDLHQSTTTYGTTFQIGMRCGVNLELCVDADHAEEANNRRSVSGGVVMCAGVCVLHYSRTQR